MAQAASAAEAGEDDIYGGNSIAEGAETRPAKRQRLDSGQEAGEGEAPNAQSEDDEVMPPVTQPKSGRCCMLVPNPLLTPCADVVMIAKFILSSRNQHSSLIVLFKLSMQRLSCPCNKGNDGSLRTRRAVHSQAAALYAVVDRAEGPQHLAKRTFHVVDSLPGTAPICDMASALLMSSLIFGRDVITRLGRSCGRNQV